MTAEKLPPWARMSLGYDDDPKVVALARFGADAGLCRDLHLAAIRYCRRNETDGWVPAEQMTRLAWPLPVDHAERLVAHLADVELIVAMTPAMAGAIAPAMAGGWRVPNYERWQETRDEIEAYTTAQSERGRLGAEKRWSRARMMAGAMAGAERPPRRSDGEPIAEREIERESSSARPRASAPAREDDADGQDDDDDALINQIAAMLRAHGPIAVEQVRAYCAALTAGRDLTNPAAYLIGAIRRDSAKSYREALAAAPGPASSARPLPPAARSICHRCGKSGHRPEDCPTRDQAGALAEDRAAVAEHGGGAVARRLLAERERDEPPAAEPPAVEPPAEQLALTAARSAAADDDEINPDDYPF